MSRPDRSILFAAILMIVGAVVNSATAAEAPPGVDKEADRILREMGEYLKTAREFTFRAEINYDEVEENGESIEYGGVAKMALRRPDKLRVVHSGDERQSQIIFDGQTFVLYDEAKGFYARKEMPSDIDTALDRMFERFDFTVPIADLAYADPYSTLIANVETGHVVGRHAVDGVPCHHLSFTQEAIDWQIWIEDGPRPLPRKLVITYREELGSPRYRAKMSGWDFQPRSSDHYFEFHPPVEAQEIEFLPVQETEEMPWPANSEP